MPFAAPNFVKTCTEAELNHFLSFCRPVYKGWIAPPDISFRAGVKSMKEWSWKFQQNGCWFLALGRERRMLKNVPAGQNCSKCALACQLNKPEFCRSPRRIIWIVSFWNLPNGKLFLRSEQESKARAAPCLTSIPEGSVINAQRDCLFGSSKEQAAHG